MLDASVYEPGEYAVSWFITLGKVIASKPDPATKICFLGGIDIPEHCFGVLNVYKNFGKGSVYGAFLLLRIIY